MQDNNTSLEKLEERLPQRRSSSHRIYWWVLAEHEGKSVIFGPKATEEEAYNLGFDKLNGRFEVVSLPTRDRAKATSMLKARMFEDTGDLDKSLRKFRHKLEQEGGK